MYTCIIAIIPHKIRNVVKNHNSDDLRDTGRNLAFILSFMIREQAYRN